MEPQLISLASLLFPPLCSLPSLAWFFLWVFLLAALPMLCRNMLKLNMVKGLFSSHSPVLDPLSCVQRKVAVVLIIVVKFLLAASFLCEVLLL